MRLGSLGFMAIVVGATFTACESEDDSAGSGTVGATSGVGHDAGRAAGDEAGAPHGVSGGPSPHSSGGAAGELGTGGLPSLGGADSGAPQTSGDCSYGGLDTAGNGNGSSGEAGVPPTTACLVTLECDSGTCLGDDTAKLCVRQRSACNTHDDCPRDHYCEVGCRRAAGLEQPCSAGDRCGTVTSPRSLQLNCVSGVCVLPHLLGEACEDWEGNLPDRCEAGTTCSRSLVDPQTVTCQPLSKAGESCAFGRRCDDESFCEREPGYELLCLPKPALDHFPYLCGYYSGPCREGQYCSLDEGCQLSAALDEPCITPELCDFFGGAFDGGCSPCGLGLMCVEGTCKAPAGYAESCSALGCAAGLVCVDAQVNGSCTDR